MGDLIRGIFTYIFTGKAETCWEIFYTIDDNQEDAWRIEVYGTDPDDALERFLRVQKFVEVKKILVVRPLQLKNMVQLWNL